MSDDRPGWKLTAKLPLLLGGLLLLLAGWFISLRGGARALVAGVALMLAGLAMVVWSESIHNWCVPNDMKWGNVPFGQMRFHDGPPSLRDCLALTGIVDPPKAWTFDQVKDAAGNGKGK